MKLVLRADAGPRLGAGHLLRCATLARAWNAAGGESLLVTACSNPRLLRLATAAGCAVRQVPERFPAAAFVVMAGAANAERVAVDGYHFDGEYQARIVEAGHRLLVVDDFNHLPRYRARWILNQNHGAENYAYAAEPGTRLLLGTRYVLLAPAFLAYTGRERAVPETAHNVLVTLGGGEQGAATLKVLEALERVEAALEVRVVVGAESASGQRIRDAGAASRHTVEVVERIDDLAPLMAWADAAVSAGGTTSWELAAMGLPALLVATADNQEAIVAALGRDGYALAAGRIADLAVGELAAGCDRLIRGRALRAELSRRSRSLVDGGGARRVVQALREG